MALVVCCPCGNPIDFEHIELIVTLTCPQCKRELDLELESGPVDRRRAVLTVMEGPHWVGERFLVPIGVDLQIGQSGGNWISLDDDTVSAIHCRLKLLQDGSVVVEDRQSKTGTWIGNQRIARGKLAPRQSIRVGKFRMRLDYQAVDGSTIITSPPETATDSSGLLPAMASVHAKLTAAGWMITNRFRFCRWVMGIAAWTMGICHAVGFHSSPALVWRWPVAIVGGLFVVVLLTLAGRRVTLAHTYYKYAPIALLVVLTILDLIWSLTMPAVASLGLAACLSLLIIATPRPAIAVVGGCTGLLAIITLAVAAIRSLMSLNV